MQKESVRTQVLPLIGKVCVCTFTKILDLSPWRLTVLRTDSYSDWPMLCPQFNIPDVKHFKHHPSHFPVEWSEVKVVRSCLTLGPRGLYSPWNSPGQNRVGSLSLLQGIFRTQGSNPGLALQADSSLSEPPGKPSLTCGCHQFLPFSKFLFNNLELLWYFVTAF